MQSSLAAKCALGLGQFMLAAGVLLFASAGSLPVILGMPLALGSLWTVLLSVLLVAALLVRLVDEERYLVEHLPGYAAYCQRARWRLIPWIY